MSMVHTEAWWIRNYHRHSILCTGKSHSQIGRYRYPAMKAFASVFGAWHSSLGMMNLAIQLRWYYVPDVSRIGFPFASSPSSGADQLRVGNVGSSLTRTPTNRPGEAGKASQAVQLRRWTRLQIRLRIRLRRRLKLLRESGWEQKTAI